LATGGDLKGPLLQALNLALSAALYYPFFKAWERILLTSEEDALPGLEENRAAVAAQIHVRVAARGRTLS
jgi:PTS system cellobiose-specific IIC component